MFDLSAIKKPRSFGDAAFFGKQKSRGFQGPAALVFKGFLKTPSSSPPRYDNYYDAAQYNEFVFHLTCFICLQSEKVKAPYENKQFLSRIFL